jgi:hypothetical protein
MDAVYQIYERTAWTRVLLLKSLITQLMTSSRAFWITQKFSSIFTSFTFRTESLSTDNDYTVQYSDLRPQKVTQGSAKSPARIAQGLSELGLEHTNDVFMIKFNIIYPLRLHLPGGSAVHSGYTIKVYVTRVCHAYYMSRASFLHHYNIFLFHGTAAPSRPGTPHIRGFVITLRHTTLGRTPLDEWSAQCRDLYLTTRKTHNRQIPIHRRDS